MVDAALAPYAEWIEVKHSASAIDITPVGVSKASAVRLLLEWSGLQPLEVLGVGDTPADAAWLQVTGWRAAPANGREQLPGLHFYAEEPVTRGLLEILRRVQARDFTGF